MNIYEAAEVIKDMQNEEYTDQERLEAIAEILAAETLNGIPKIDIVSAFRWYKSYHEATLEYYFHRKNVQI